MNPVPWDQVPEDRLIEGITRRIVTGERVMLGRIHFPKGARVPAHTHESEQITHVLSGALRFVVAGEEMVVQCRRDSHHPVIRGAQRRGAGRDRRH